MTTTAVGPIVHQQLLGRPKEQCREVEVVAEGEEEAEERPNRAGEPEEQEEKERKHKKMEETKN